MYTVSVKGSHDKITRGITLMVEWRQRRRSQLMLRRMRDKDVGVTLQCVDLVLVCCMNLTGYRVVFVLHVPSV